ncbi:MAG: CDP-alcohol phosphatidyltransferase family protein, partial [Actinomycetota bacterium]
MNSKLEVMTLRPETTLSQVIEKFSSTDSDLILREEGLELHQPYLDEIEDFPHRQSALLVASSKTGSEADIYVRNKLVRSIATSIHDCPAANRVFLGIVRLSQGDRDRIVQALNQANSREFEAIPVANLVVLALVRSAIAISPVSIDKAEWQNPARGRNGRVRELTTSKARRLKLNLANRSNDGFFSVLVLRRLSKPLTAFSVKFGISPNLITLISLLVGFYAAYLFSQSQYLAGAIFFQLSLIIDCSDGEVARYTRKFSDFGRWFDASTDRVKEYLVYASLAYSAGEKWWIFAIALMTLQTIRHLSDYTFAAISQEREGGLIARDISLRDDGYSSPEWRGESDFKYWVKKILNLPIGERWLAISVLAAIGGGALVFPGMLFLGLVSIFYAWLTRIRRTLTWKSPTAHGLVALMQQDLLLFSKRFGGRYEWMVPSLLRKIELVVVTSLAYLIDPDLVGGILFFTLFAIVYHHYDALYRSLQSQSFPTWLSWLGLKVEGRITALTLALLLDLPILFFAIYFISLFMVIASVQWFQQLKRSKA